jgi:hypothetical protein
VHVPDLKHEFKINPYILPQVVICGIHKVPKFAPQDVVGVPWDEFGLDAFLKEFPSVTMVFPFLLSHYLPTCGGITFQVGLGELHGRVPSNLGYMQIILHFNKPNIHNLLVVGTIKVAGFDQLESRIFEWPRFEGCNQLIEIRPIHFEEDFQLFRGE